MGSIDKAAIVFSIAITIIGVGIAAMGSSIDYSPSTIVDTSMTAERDLVAAQAAADKAAADAAPKTVSVEVPSGTSSPGCEETNACYLPTKVTISVGDTVEWDNVDTAAHTVSSGSPAEGPSGVFDSSLLMANASFAFTFEDAGNYDYFCMVHPWMVGNVTVN